MILFILRCKDTDANIWNETAPWHSKSKGHICNRYQYVFFSVKTGFIW